MHFISLGSPHFQLWTWADQEWAFPSTVHFPRSEKSHTVSASHSVSRAQPSREAGVKPVWSPRKDWHRFKIFVFFVLPEKSTNQCSEVAWLRAVALQYQISWCRWKGCVFFRRMRFIQLISMGKYISLSCWNKLAALPCFCVINEVFAVCCGAILKDAWNSKMCW